MSVAFSTRLFGIGVALVVWATERLLEGLVGLAWLLRISAFAVAAILSVFEAENVAAGLAAARRGVGLGDGIRRGCLPGVRRPGPWGGAVSAAGEVARRLPRADGGLPVDGRVVCSRPPGGCGAARGLHPGRRLSEVVASRHHRFLESDEVLEAEEKRRSYKEAVGLSVLGLAVIAVGGELVTVGAEGIGLRPRSPSLLVGMVCGHRGRGGNPAGRPCQVFSVVSAVIFGHFPAFLLWLQPRP